MDARPHTTANASEWPMVNRSPTQNATNQTTKCSTLIATAPMAAVVLGTSMYRGLRASMCRLPPCSLKRRSSSARLA